MKKVITISLTIMSIAILIISCSKSNNKETNNLKFIKISDNNNWDHASNPNNPYDSIGYLHNITLKNTIEQYPMNELNVPNVYNSGIEFSKERFGTNLTNTLTQDYTVTTLGEINNYLNENNNFAETIQETNIKEGLKAPITELITDIIDTSYQYSSNYDSLKEKIINWENEIIVSNNYNNEDKLVLLSTSSILRYSLYSWWSATIPSNNQGYIKIGLFKKVVGILATAASDAIAGAVVASMGGPAGAIIVGASGSALAVVVLYDKGYLIKNKKMKQLILTAVSCTALAFHTSAQTQIGVGVNGFYATQRPSNVDIISASGGFFHIAHNFKLNKNWNLEPQIQLGASKLIMDGLFYKTPLNGYEFVNTSASVKQSYLQLYSVRVPVHLKYALFKDSQGKPFGYLGVGPYSEYIGSAKQYYKIGNDNYKENAPIQNKFNYGLSFELSLYGNGVFKNGKNPFSFHIGGMYQMSEYLKDKPSFTPFMPYIKLGINLK